MLPPCRALGKPLLTGFDVQSQRHPRATGRSARPQRGFGCHPTQRSAKASWRWAAPPQVPHCCGAESRTPNLGWRCSTRPTKPTCPKPTSRLLCRRSMPMPMGLLHPLHVPTIRSGKGLERPQNPIHWAETTPPTTSLTFLWIQSTHGSSPGCLCGCGRTPPRSPATTHRHRIG